jgi:hypothetical protein
MAQGVAWACGFQSKALGNFDSLEEWWVCDLLIEWAAAKGSHLLPSSYCLEALE